MATTEKIITHENGPAYAHWATEATLESLLDCCKKQGFSQADVTNLINQLEGLNENGKVDTVALRGVLANIKKDSNLARERDKTAEEQGKKEIGFWQKSQDMGRKTAQAFKDSNLGDQLKGAGDMFLMPVDTLSDAFVKVAGVVGSVGNILGNFGKKVIDNIKILGKWGQGLLKGMLGFAGVIGGLATTVIGGLLGVIEQLGDSFFELYDTGINFAKGLDNTQTGLGALAMAAADARLTVGEFAEFIAENSRVAVAIGAEAMGALSSTVRSALYPLGNLGLTAAETNEHLGEYLEMQRTLGVLDTMTKAQQARASADYLVNLTLLTQITGKRRKQIAADMKSATENTALTAWMIQMGAAEKAQAMKNVEAVTGVLAAINPEAANGFTEALGKGSVFLTDYGNTMASAGFTQEMAMQNELIQRIKSGDITEEQAQSEILRIQRSMRANGSAMQQLYALAQAGDSAAQAAVDHMRALEGADLSAANWSKRLGNAEKGIGSWDEMQRSVSQTWTNFIAGLFADDDFSEGINEMAGKLQEFLKPDGAFATGVADFAKNSGPKLIDGMKALGLAMPDIIDWFKKLPDILDKLWTTVQAGVTSLRSVFIEQDKEDPNYGKMKDFGTIMGEQLIKGAKSLPWLNIALAIAAVFATKAFLGALGGAVSRKFMGGGGGGKVPGGGPPGRTAGGALGANVGQFVGNLGGGVITGFGRALAGLGPMAPMIILGAGAIGLAIAEIALGIGAATWILGYSMGPFAESLKKFDELNGKNLLLVGAGMAAIGVGLGVSGLGGAVGAVGNLVGAGFEKLGSLFGVKGPLTKLKEFAEAGKDLDIEGIKKASEGMAAFSKAMALAGGSTAVSGLGTLISGIATGLNSLMGVQTDPIAQMKAFGKEKIPLENIENNAKAMAAFGKAMEGAPVVTAKASTGIFDLVLGAFGGGVSYAWDKVKLFADAEIDSAKVTKNAASMKAFAGAMDGIKPVTTTTEGSIFAGIKNWFGLTDVYPWDQVTKFGEAEINGAKVKINAAAMKDFASGMTGAPAVTTGSGGIFDLIFATFGGVKTFPWDNLKKFGAAEIDAGGVKKNAGAMKAFSEALAGYPTNIPITEVGGVWDFMTGWATSEKKMPWDILIDLGNAKIPLAATLANIGALHAFGEAIALLPEDMVGKLESVGNSIAAMNRIGATNKFKSTGTNPAWASMPTRTQRQRDAQSEKRKEWEAEQKVVNEELKTLSIDAKLLTASQDSIALLQDICSLLRDGTVAARKNSKKQENAIKANSEYVGG